MSEPITIRQVIDDVLAGRIRIPAFQRGFVWDADRVAFFMDSLYKRYPFGNLLFWRTNTPLSSERKLGPFVLPERDPDYPVDYVLDGQQRITSIFGVFQTELDPGADADWAKIYFDYRADPDVQESQFLALSDAEVDWERHFPLHCLFDTVLYRQKTKDLPDATAVKIDELQARFKEARLPVQTIKTEDRATVAIVFERVNQRGVPLDTLQLLSAWTWSDEFDLQQKFSDLAEELEPFGFQEVGGDSNLLLRCCAAVLANDAAPDTLMQLNGADVRNRFQEILNGVRGAIDFLRNSLNAQSLSNLPYPTIIVPLTVFFSALGNDHVQYTDAQRLRLIRWFWRTCFSRRYSSGVLRNLSSDINEVLRLKNGEQDSLGDFACNVGPDFYASNSFKIDSVNTKTFVLQLAQTQPRSFITGAPVALANVLRDYNRREFHHLFPRAYLRARNAPEEEINCLANFCFLSRNDNVALGGDAPSIYRARMPADSAAILQSALCPNNLFDDNYTAFIATRVEMLRHNAEALL